jgi:hypothetical protein
MNILIASASRKKQQAFTTTPQVTITHTSKYKLSKKCPQILPTNYRLEREEMWIKRLSTKTPHGLNKQD